MKHLHYKYAKEQTGVEWINIHDKVAQPAGSIRWAVRNPSPGWALYPIIFKDPSHANRDHPRWKQKRTHWGRVCHHSSFTLNPSTCVLGGISRGHLFYPSCLHQLPSDLLRNVAIQHPRLKGRRRHRQTVTKFTSVNQVTQCSRCLAWGSHTRPGLPLVHPLL